MKALIRFACVIAACLAMPAAAQVTGISYTLTPLAERVFFDRNAGLSDATFLGGRLGFGFGEYTELSGVYLESTRLETDFEGFRALGEEHEDRFRLLPPRDVRTRQLGAALKFNLGRGALFPFVALGTGILQFDPENIDRSRVIYLTGAAGLQFALSDHFGLLVQAQDLAYRYNPAGALLSANDLSDLGLSPGDFRQMNVHNLALRVGLQMYAGGRARGELTEADRALREQFSRGLSGVRLQVEPMGGMIEFREELGFRTRQRLAGVLAGIDLGPFVGLRSFYWRGIREGALTDFDDLQAYGGEVKLKFGGGIAPHLILGGGYLDVLEGYEGTGLVQPVDQPFAYGGAGVSIPIAGALQLHGGVRTLLMSAEDVEDVSEPSQITTNFLYSAGISFGIGGGGARRPAGMGAPPSTRGLTAADVELARAQRRIDSLTIALQLARRLRPPADTAPGLEEDPEGRWISIPLPARGEVYLRYGERAGAETGEPPVVYVDPETGAVVRDPRVVYANPETGAVVRDPRVVYVNPETGAVVRGPGAAGDGALSAAEIRAIVRDVLRRELGAGGRNVAAPREEPLSQTERRLLDRIAELERRLAAGEAAPPPTPSRGGGGASSPVSAGGGYELWAVMPFAGVGFAADQVALAGVRADLRSRSLAGARFLPELAVAAGTEGPSFGINAGAAFPLGFAVGSFRPYAGLGLGLITTGGAELVFNLFGGVEQAGPAGRLFVEYMSQDFFDLNRLVVGYRLSF